MLNLLGLKSRVKNFITRKLVNRVNFGGSISVNPVSQLFGNDRGTPLDRVYIEKFLNANRNLIHGHCLEVEEATYTRRFGQPGHLAHVLKYSASGENQDSYEVVADLVNPNTIPENRFDTFICTQTLNFIFETEKAVTSIFKLLKPGGHALISVGGISQISRYDYDRWGDFWRFTDLSLKNLFAKHPECGECNVRTFGNVATSCLFLQGVAYEDIGDKAIFDSVDPNYQMVICAVVTKA